MAITNAQLNGYVKDMADLLRSGAPISPIAGNFIASLLEGKTRLPDQRGKANSDLSPADAEKLDGWLYEMHTYAAQALALVETLADELAVEPFQIRSKINQRKQETTRKLAEHFGLSENTVRQRMSARDVGAWAEVMIGDRQLQTPNGHTFDFHPSQEDQENSRRVALMITKRWLNNPDLFPDLSE